MIKLPKFILKLENNESWDFFFSHEGKMKVKIFFNQEFIYGITSLLQGSSIVCIT